MRAGREVDPTQKPYRVRALLSPNIDHSLLIIIIIIIALLLIQLQDHAFIYLFIRSVNQSIIVTTTTTRTTSPDRRLFLLLAFYVVA